MLFARNSQSLPGPLRSSRSRLRRALLAAAVVLAAASPAPGHDDVVIVVSSDAAPYAQAAQAIGNGLRPHDRGTETLDLGELTDAALEELRRQGSHTFAAVGSPAAMSLNGRLADDEQLFYCLVPDPQGKGITDKATVSGISMDVPIEAQFVLIGRALPEARRVGMIYRSKDVRSHRLMREVRDHLPKGWTLEAVDADGYEKVGEAIEALFARQPHVVWTSLDTAVYDTSAVRSVLLVGLRRGVPVFGFSPQVVRAGALVGIGINPATQGADCGNLIIERLDGDSTGQESVVRAPQFEIAVNEAIAERLSVELPSSLVEEATHVYGRE